MSEKNTDETGPVPALAVTQQGSTFAERAAAAKRTEDEAQSKSVDAESVEDKAVARKKTASKKG